MSLKSRIEALTTQISNAKTSLRSALSNKGVSVPISPTWDEITQGINDIEIPVMPKVSLSFSSGIYSAYLEGGNFNTVEYTVYYNGRIKFNPGTNSIHCKLDEWGFSKQSHRLVCSKYQVRLVLDLLNPSWLSQN